MTSRKTRLIAFGLAFAGSLVGVAPASAQFGQAAGFGEVMSPYFLRRDLNLIVDGLSLDDEQAVIVESLFFDYEADHERAKAAMMESMQSLKDVAQNADRAELLDMVFKPFEEKAEAWEIGRTQFIENLQLILGADQRDQFPEFMRDLRRQKELPSGMLSGESVDLIQVLDTVGYAGSRLASLGTLADDYELALDLALQAREVEIANGRLPMMQTLKDDDHSLALQLYKTQIDRRLAVRNVNDEYIDLIAAAMPEDDASAFRTEALSRGYARIYRPTSSQRIFKAAKKLETISAETLVAIEELEAAYLAELFVINDELVYLVRVSEPKEEMDQAERAATGQRRDLNRGGQAPANPTRDGFTRRQVLGKQYMKMLQGILTKSEFASLPGASRFLPRKVGENLIGAEQDQPGANKPKPGTPGQRRPDRTGGSGS